MAVRDYIIAVYAKEHDVQDNQYPLMSVFFNGTLIKSNIEVKESRNNTYTEPSEPLVPVSTKIQYSGREGRSRRDAREDIVGYFNYKFVVSLNDNSDNNLITEHSIKLKFDDPNLTSSIHLKKIELNEIALVAYLNVLNNENPEYELKFKMPIYPHMKAVKYIGNTGNDVDYVNLFPTPISCRHFKNHECKDTLIEMIHDYYESQDSNTSGQDVPSGQRRIIERGMGRSSSYDGAPTWSLDKNILYSNPSLKPLWISFQNAFDDHCVKFNLPKVIIVASWFIWYKILDSIQSHTHPASSLVGAYYPYADEGSSPIIFEHPFNDVIATNNIRRMGYNSIHADLNTEEYQIEELHVEPISEMFNIFPGYLRHCVRPNQTEHRYILVTNTVLYSEKDRFGLKDLRYENI